MAKNDTDFNGIIHTRHQNSSCQTCSLPTAPITILLATRSDDQCSSDRSDKVISERQQTSCARGRHI